MVTLQSKLAVRNFSLFWLTQCCFNVYFLSYDVIDNVLVETNFIPKQPKNEAGEKMIKNGGFYQNHWVASGKDIYISLATCQPMNI